MHRSPTIVRRAALLAVTAALVTACGGSDDESSTTDATPAETTVPETTAPATTVPDTTVPATTVAPTTAPPATTPETTEPAPPTTEADTSIPGDVDPVLAQFCFDSEQAYVFNQVTNVLTDPTPEQAEASLSILAFTIDAAAASAPEGMAEQPQRASEIMGELIPVFEEYAYDVDAISESGALEPMAESFAEFDSIMTQLADFVDAECTPARAVLDSQAIKLAPVIDQLRDWPLQPIANQAGDIRLLVSADWPEWIGSTEVEAVTLLQASNDLDEFDATWNVPGVAATVGYVEPGTADLAILFETSLAAPDCTLDSSEDYVDDVYYGQLYLLSECGGVDTDAAVLAVTDGATESVEVSLEFQFPGGYDRALLDQMLATFAAGA